MLNFRHDSLKKIILIQFVLILSQVRGYENERRLGGDHRPIGGRFYFAIAASPSSQGYSRAFNKTLTNITQNYLAGKSGRFNFNISLETMVIELPKNGSFSAVLLETVCDKFDDKRVVAVLIIGYSPAAFTVSLAAKHAGIPVLWARGYSAILPGFRSLESSSLEVHLAPTGRELVQALRGLLMQAHWHTFMVLADQTSATALRRPELWDALAAAPLHPSLVSLPSPLRPQSLFRKLADISRSTRGVVILMSDRSSAIRILNDAKRLNMMDGHFVWIWIDTAATINVKNVTEDEKDLKDKSEDRVKRSSLEKSDISDMHISYLLKNDQFLLFNRNNGVESSKLKDRRAHHRPREGGIGDSKGELPSGLLSLKPLSVKVDRHLVKGAVRLLVAALKLVIDSSPEWMLNNFMNGQLTNNCWKNVATKENSFISEFARWRAFKCIIFSTWNVCRQIIRVREVSPQLLELDGTNPQSEMLNSTANVPRLAMHYFGISAGVATSFIETNYQTLTSFALIMRYGTLMSA